MCVCDICMCISHPLYYTIDTGDALAAVQHRALQEDRQHRLEQQQQQGRVLLVCSIDNCKLLISIIMYFLTSVAVSFRAHILFGKVVLW